MIAINGDTEAILGLIGYTEKQVQDIMKRIAENNFDISVTVEETEYLVQDNYEIWWTNNKDIVMEMSIKFEPNYKYEFVEE